MTEDQKTEILRDYQRGKKITEISRAVDIPPADVRRHLVSLETWDAARARHWEARNAATKERLKKVCEFCGETYYSTPGRVLTQKFCSYECSGKGRNR